MTPRAHALVIAWNEGANAKINSSDIWDDLRAASKKDGVVAKSVGDVAKGLTQGERVDSEYELPFLAHATMEPLNCTVHVTSDSCEVWTGSQVISRVQEYAAKAAGLPLEKGPRQSLHDADRHPDGDIGETVDRSTTQGSVHHDALQPFRHHRPSCP